MVFNLLLTMAEFFDFGCFINDINPAIHILPIHFIRFAHSVAATDFIDSLIQWLPPGTWRFTHSVAAAWGISWDKSVSKKFLIFFIFLLDGQLFYLYD